MPPIHRMHDGTVLVPVALLDAIDSAFGVRDGCCEDFALHPVEACRLERVCVVPHRGRDLIPTATAALCRARNVLDDWTLRSSCEPSDAAPVALMGTSARSWWATCDFCLWCQALIMRDWCDEVLDRAGHVADAWIGTVGPDSDVGRRYADIWIEVNRLYHEAQQEHA